jgi:hypothetical protein
LKKGRIALLSAVVHSFAIYAFGMKMPGSRITGRPVGDELASSIFQGCVLMSTKQISRNFRNACGHCRLVVFVISFCSTIEVYLPIRLELTSLASAAPSNHIQPALNCAPARSVASQLQAKITPLSQFSQFSVPSH